MPTSPLDFRRSFHSASAPCVPMSDNTGVAVFRALSAPADSASFLTNAWLPGGKLSKGTVKNILAITTESPNSWCTAAVNACAASSRQLACSTCDATPVQRSVIVDAVVCSIFIVLPSPTRWARGA